MLPGRTDNAVKNRANSQLRSRPLAGACPSPPPPSPSPPPSPAPKGARARSRAHMPGPPPPPLRFCPPPPQPCSAGSFHRLPRGQYCGGGGVHTLSPLAPHTPTPPCARPPPLPLPEQPPPPPASLYHTTGTRPCRAGTLPPRADAGAKRQPLPPPASGRPAPLTTPRATPPEAHSSTSPRPPRRRHSATGGGGGRRRRQRAREPLHRGGRPCHLAARAVLHHRPAPARAHQSAEADSDRDEDGSGGGGVSAFDVSRLRLLEAHAARGPPAAVRPSGCCPLHRRPSRVRNRARAARMASPAARRTARRRRRRCRRW